MPWWFRQNEKRWNGPQRDREEAIGEGSSKYDIEQFMIMEAELGEYDLSPDGKRIVEMLNSINADRDGPDQSLPFAYLTPKQIDSLGQFVDKAIEAWAKANRISATSRYFTKQGEPEIIPAIDEAAISASSELAGEKAGLAKGIQNCPELHHAPDWDLQTGNEMYSKADGDKSFLTTRSGSLPSWCNDRITGIGLVVAIVAGVLFVVPPLLHLKAGWECIFSYGTCN